MFPRRSRNFNAGDRSRTTIIVKDQCLVFGVGRKGKPAPPRQDEGASDCCHRRPDSLAVWGQTQKKVRRRLWVRWRGKLYLFDLLECSEQIDSLSFCGSERRDNLKVCQEHQEFAPPAMTAPILIKLINNHNNR